MIRKHPLEPGEVYHIMNKSIAGFKILNTDYDYRRMLQALEYFSIADQLPKFSYFLNRAKEIGKTFEEYLEQCFPDPDRRIQIVSYCFMPTHFHFILISKTENGITDAMHDTLSSYSHYFNVKHKRRGPLWVGPFKNVHVESDEQLWHLTRYIHLNPVTSNLVEKAEDWQHSSYKEYISPSKAARRLCEYEELLEIKPRSYQKFVEDQADYQQELAKIKSIVLE